MQAGEKTKNNRNTTTEYNHKPASPPPHMPQNIKLLAECAFIYENATKVFQIGECDEAKVLAD